MRPRKASKIRELWAKLSAVCGIESHKMYTYKALEIGDLRTMRLPNEGVCTV